MPNPVGLKNFVLCGQSGRMLDFEIYQGAGTGVPEESKHLGLGGSIVMRLAQTIPSNQNYKLNFDNYFTSVPLIYQLKSRGIHSLGVVKKNRMSGCQLKEEKELKKEGRGAIDMKITNDGSVCVVRWLDNGIVTLASSFAGKNEVDQVRRWSESAKEHLMVNRPFCVRMYNDHMGSVDNHDRMISYYRIKPRTKQWPVRVIFHFVDMALVNSWLLYREQEIKKGNNRPMDLLSFRDEVGDALLLSSAKRPSRNSVGRPSRQLDDQTCSSFTQQQRRNTECIPVSDVRHNGAGHWPFVADGIGKRYKLDGCGGRSRERWEKCQVSLCKTKDKNCFKKFHVK